MQLHLSYFGNLQPEKLPIHCRVSLGGEFSRTIDKPAPSMKMLLYLAIAFLFPCSFGDPPPALEGAHMEFESLEIITDNDVPCMKITCSVTHTAKESIMEFPPKSLPSAECR